MSKIQAKNAAVLSVADTIERTTGRHAQKKPPRAVSGDFSAIADGYIQAATAESTRRNFASDMRHLESNDIFPESPPAAVLEYLAKFAGSMPFCVELDNLKDTDAPIHQPAAMLVAAD